MTAGELPSGPACRARPNRAGAGTTACVELRDLDGELVPVAELLLGSVTGSVLAAKRLVGSGRVRGVEEEGELAACVVTAERGDGALVIEAIVVAPGRRGDGLGRSMIETLRDGLQMLVAEASEDSVGFFRSCGFAIESAGGTPYERRYVCELA